MISSLSSCSRVSFEVMGGSGFTQAFDGTLSIGQEATEHLLIELARSATCTWSRVLLLSTHGGNAAVVERAVRRLRAEGRDVLAWSPSWGTDAHAGHDETSIMLVVAPDRVRLDLAERGATAPLEELLPTLVRDGVAAVSANGTLGDPTRASVEEGRRLLDEALASLCSVVDTWPGTSDGRHAA